MTILLGVGRCTTDWVCCAQMTEDIVPRLGLGPPFGRQFEGDMQYSSGAWCHIV